MNTSIYNLHQEILQELKNNSGISKENSGSNYSGNNDPSLNISMVTMRVIVKNFGKVHPNLSSEDLINLLSSLYEGTYDDEKHAASKLLQYYSKLRKDVDPKILDTWLDTLNGWCQVDSLCQAVFSADDMNLRWNEWKSLLKQFARSKNISKRRASIVLLTSPLRQSTDEKLSILALSLIDILKFEKDILITKAISWVLRVMVKHHKNEVALYLQNNQESLPKIALREVKRKLETGKK